MENKQEWLDSLKEGDKVALKSFYHSSFNYDIKEITKITPTRIIKVGGYEFNSDGRQRGRASAWGRSIYLEPVKQDVLDMVERNKLCTKVKNTKFETLTLDQLRKIDQIISE